MNELLGVLRVLRAPDGCPWDRKQTHESLRAQLLEEAAEAVDALASGVDSAMVEELGDVLLHVAFHAVIAEEEERWSFAEVEQAIVEKLIRRHPHVFGGEDAEDAEAVEATWARVKAEERGSTVIDPVDRVPRSLPALARAGELGMALAWPEDGAALARAAQGAEDAATLVAALTSLAVRAQQAGHDPELLLRDGLQARLEARAVDASQDSEA